MRTSPAELDNTISNQQRFVLNTLLKIQPQGDGPESEINPTEIELAQCRKNIR